MKWMNHLLKCDEGKPDIPSASKNKKLKGYYVTLGFKIWSAIFGAGAYREELHKNYVLNSWVVVTEFSGESPLA